MSDQPDGEPDAEPTPDVEPDQAPFLRVITPSTTPEEVAAIVAVFATLGSGAEPPPARRPEWNAPRRLHRTTFPSGPGAWRASGLPR